MPFPEIPEFEDKPTFSVARFNRLSFCRYPTLRESRLAWRGLSSAAGPTRR
jgi:hypothetical protein